MIKTAIIDRAISHTSKEGRKEMFYLTTHATHFIYGYMASDIWLRTILIVRKQTSCRHIGYSLRLTARVLLYAPSHRQDSTYHGLCYTSHGAHKSKDSLYRFIRLIMTIRPIFKVMIRAFAHCAMGRRIDPTWRTY